MDAPAGCSGLKKGRVLPAPHAWDQGLGVFPMGLASHSLLRFAAPLEALLENTERDGVSSA